MSGRIKVVLDTNILVSALWSESGNPATVIKLMPSLIIPCFSDLIFSEYTDILNRPRFDFSVYKREELLSKIKIYGKMVFPSKSDISLPDETDRIFYDAAQSCGAILITGNKRHFPDESFIVTPADFLREYEKRRSI
jgi:putative PIN family toxin of toxin-antitoxin system